MTAGLLADRITVRYGSNTAVDAVSISVGRGEIVGLIGPNGAGKTSLIDAVTGLAPMAGGKVFLDGADITTWAPHRRANAGMRRTFQSLRLFDDLTVTENLVVAAESDTLFGFLRDLFRPQHAPIATEQTLALTGLERYASAFPRDLPAGTRRLVGVARAVVSQPAVVLLDEPAAGLDTAETSELGSVLLRLAESGIGLLLIEHDTDLVFRVSDRVVAIDFGVEIVSGPADEVRRSEALISAYLGTAPETGPAA